MVMAGFTVIGHIAIDRIITPTDERIQLGGPPTYVSLITKNLGETVNTFTKVGDDMPNRFLRKLRDFGVDIEGMVVEGSTTTRFTLDYRDKVRHLSVENICEEIKPRDIDERLEVVLIAPIIREIPLPTVSVIDADVIALDPQGFLREVQDDGTVLPRRWFDEELMRRVTIYKSSEEELKLVTGEDDLIKGLELIKRMGADVAVATRGGKGALILSEKGPYEIPPYDVRGLLDPTGAGDVFMGAFIVEYLKGEDPLWCASVATSGASFIVETFGPDIYASKRHITDRAEEIFNHVIKL